MKKLLSAGLAVAIFSSAFAQHTPPRPPRAHLPPHPTHRRPLVPPRPKAPHEVARDVDRHLSGKSNASSHKYVKYNKGKHKGHYKKAKAKRHVVVRRHHR